MSIRTKLILLVLVIAGAPLILISVLNFTNARATLEKAHLSKLEAIADLKSSQIEEYFSGLREDIQVATSYYSVRSWLPTLTAQAHGMNDPRYEVARTALDSQLKPFRVVKGLLDVMLVDLQGQIVYVSNDKHIDRDVGRPLPDPGGKAFKEGRERVFLTQVFRNPREGGAFSILVAAPVRDLADELIGLIVFEVDMEPLYRRILDTASLGITGETLIATREGGTALFLNRLRHDPEAALQRSVTIGAAQAIPIQEAVRGESGSGIRVDYRGERVIAAWRHIPSLNWGMVAKIDVAEAFASTHDMRDLTRLIGAVMLVIVALAAAMFGNTIARPILALQRGAEAIGSGDLDHKVGTNQKDEVGRLSRAFDRMARDLKTTMASRDELDKQIKNRIAAEAALRESEGRYRSLFDLAPDGVLIIDPETTVPLIFNDAACRQLGYSREEFARLRVTDYEALESAEETRRHMENIRRVKRDDFRTRHRTKTGNIRDVYVTVQEVSFGGKPALQSVFRDVTELMRAIDELQVKARELSRSNAELQQFAYVASHDLQEPLRMVASYLQLIEQRYRGRLDEDGIEFINYAVDGANRMKSLIQGLLEYSRVQSSKRPFKPVDLGAVVGGVREDLAVLIEETGTEIICDPLPVVPGHEAQLRRLFQNLVDNSIKYHGTEAPRIHISAKPLEKAGIKTPEPVLRESWLISVKDNGMGIDMEFAERIFQIFQRLHGREEYPGSGLGLALCRRIIERHDGVIWVDSRPGSGATFYFTLPATA